MPSWLEVVLLAVVLPAVGGWLAATRAERAGRAGFERPGLEVAP